jgi:hypothetical protein
MKNFLLLSFFLPLFCAAQITFEKNYGDSTYQEGGCVLQIADGGFLIAGNGLDSTGRYDLLLMKTDSLGNLQWTKSWGGSSSDFTATIRQTADGGYLMSATTYTFSSQPGTNSDWWIFRFDAALRALHLSYFTQLLCFKLTDCAIIMAIASCFC